MVDIHSADVSVRGVAKMWSDFINNVQVQTLFFSTVLAILAWVSRQMASSKKFKLHSRYFYGGLIGAGLAGFSSCAYVFDRYNTSPLLAMVIAVNAGWLGLELIEAVATFFKEYVVEFLKYITSKDRGK